MTDHSAALPVNGDRLIGRLKALRKVWSQEGKEQADAADHQRKIDALVAAGGVRLPEGELSPATVQSIRRHRPGKLLVGPDGALSQAEAADIAGVQTEIFWPWLAARRSPGW